MPACLRSPDSRSLLVRRLRQGLGCSSGGPVRLGPLVQSLALAFHQPERTSGYASRPLPFSVSPSGYEDRGLLGQHHASSVSPAPRENVFPGPQQGSTAPPPLGGVASDLPGSTVHHGHQECRGGFLEPSSAVPRLLVDPGSRCGDSVSG